MNKGKYPIIEVTKSDFDLFAKGTQLIRLKSDNELFEFAEHFSTRFLSDGVNVPNDVFCLGNICNCYWHFENMAQEMRTRNKHFYYVMRNNVTGKVKLFTSKNEYSRRNRNVYDNWSIEGVLFTSDDSKIKSLRRKIKNKF